MNQELFLKNQWDVPHDSLIVFFTTPSLYDPGPARLWALTEILYSVNSSKSVRVSDMFVVLTVSVERQSDNGSYMTS